MPLTEQYVKRKISWLECWKSKKQKKNQYQEIPFFLLNSYRCLKERIHCNIENQGLLRHWGVVVFVVIQITFYLLLTRFCT